MIERILTITQKIEELESEKTRLLCELDAIHETLPTPLPHELPLLETDDIEDLPPSEWN